MDLEYSLLENGLDFIFSSINNINCAKDDSIDEASRKRLVKYALIHLSSGIELVFKQKLYSENWAYVFANIDSANKKLFFEGDFISVDSSRNIDRLKNLCDIPFSKKDDQIIKNLRKRRNKVEHFNIKESIESVQSIMYDSLSLILSFINNHIDLSTISDNEADLLEKIKEETKKLREVIFTKERIVEAIIKRNGLDDKLIICPECNKKFYEIDGRDSKCHFCEYTDTPENVAEEYLSNIMGISLLSCLQDGDEYPLYECFECGEDAMVFDYIKGIAVCFNCDFRISTSEIQWCSECSQPFISVHKNNELILCSNCIEYKLSKDD